MTIKNDITIVATSIVDGVQMVGGAVLSMQPVTPPTPTPEPTPPPSSRSMWAIIDYGSKSYSFEEEFGTDLGNFVEPGGHFTQRCVLCTHAELLAFSVMFRPDADGSRDEVVVELGTLFSGTPTNMGAYTATIYRGDKELVTIEVNEHYWNSRWTWESAPRKLLYDPSSAAVHDMLPTYSDTLFGSAIPLSVLRIYHGPMDLAGIQPYIPSTGERDEIGICTEGQAEYLCLRNSSAWQSVDAWLKGSGTIPWHFRDEKTHAPLDWNEYPNATMYSPNGANPYIKNPPSPITLDTAHEGSFAYVPFILTGNPYALEEMQFYCTYNVVMLPPSARNKFNLGNAVRAVAWTLRALAHCATVTPLDVPSWLKPRSYFKQRLDEERDWFMTYVNNPAAPHSGLHLLGTSAGSASAGTGFPANTWTSIWMEDFLTAVIGWIVCMGHEDWRPILEWKAQDVIARTNGKSGWIRACPTMYQLSLNEVNKPVLNNWADVWELNGHTQPANCQYIDPDVLSMSAYYTYSSYALGALAMCARAGISAAQQPYDWLLSELQKGDIAARNIKRKWAVASPDQV